MREGGGRGEGNPEGEVLPGDGVRSKRPRTVTVGEDLRRYKISFVFDVRARESERGKERERELD